jgi:hypothetical protein
MAWLANVTKKFYNLLMNLVFAAIQPLKKFYETVFI